MDELTRKLVEVTGGRPQSEWSATTRERVVRVIARFVYEEIQEERRRSETRKPR